MLIGHSLADANGTLLEVDASLCEILQREERELVGLGYQALTHPDDCVRNTIIITRLRNGANSSTIRKRYLLPDGSVIWASVQASRLQGSEHIIGTIQLPDAGPLRSGPERLWKAALIEDGRVQRRRLQLGEDLFADHAWLTLLQIYLAEAEGRTATPRSIGDDAAILPATIAGWLVPLAQNRWIEQASSPDQPLQLTDKAWKKIEYLLDGTFDG